MLLCYSHILILHVHFCIIVPITMVTALSIAQLYIVISAHLFVYFLLTLTYNCAVSMTFLTNFSVFGIEFKHACGSIDVIYIMVAKKRVFLRIFSTVHCYN